MQPNVYRCPGKRTLIETLLIRAEAGRRHQDAGAQHLTPGLNIVTPRKL
jgi:hypothetical protein